MSKVKGQIEVLELAQIRPRLLNLKDSSRYIGMSYNTLKNQRSLNRFPVQAVTRGGKPFYLVEELDQYLDKLPKERVYGKNNVHKRE